MPEIIPDRFVVRRALAATWVTKNDVLLEGEIGLEKDTVWPISGGRKFKFGPGAWNDLPYAVADASSVGGGGVKRPPGNSYTVAAADDGYTVISGDATGFALTLPLNATTPIDIGAKIAYTQGAAGPITVAGETLAVVVHAPNGNTTGALFDGGVAEKIGTDEWQLWNGPALGSLAAVDDAPSDSKIYGRKNGTWTEAAGGSGGGITAMNEQTGTSYTLVLADATKAVRCTNSGAVTLTIPPSASVAIPVLSSIPIFQGGAGVVTVTAGAGVTFEAPNGSATTAIGDFRTAFQRATNIWVIG